MGSTIRIVKPTSVVKAVQERRSSVRCRCLGACAVALPGYRIVPGLTYNLSRSGVGVALLRPVVVGTKLVVEKVGWPDTRSLRATVVRHQLLGFAWLHGCRLSTPMSDEELRDWLK
jgi:hypothetical protein